MWFVIQTQSGKERLVKRMIESTVSPECYDECRIIFCEMKRRYHGAWHLEKKPMFPGYLFIIANDTEKLYMELKKIPQMTRLLGNEGGVAAPISEEEEFFLKTLSAGSESVSMSYGYQEGDIVTIREGSLKGFESRIVKIDRHKRKAFIEVDLLGETRSVEVGLEIVEKR